MDLDGYGWLDNNKFTTIVTIVYCFYCVCVTHNSYNKSTVKKDGKETTTKKLEQDSYNVEHCRTL